MYSFSHFWYFDLHICMKERDQNSVVGSMVLFCFPYRFVYCFWNTLYQLLFRQIQSDEVSNDIGTHLKHKLYMYYESLAISYVINDIC